MKKHLLRKVAILSGALLCATSVQAQPNVPASPAVIPPAGATPPAAPPVPDLTLDEMEKVFGKPTRISANFQNKQLSQVLDELGKQAGVRIMGANLKIDANAAVNFQANDMPFWSALQEVLMPTKLRVSPYSYSPDSLQSDIRLMAAREGGENADAVKTVALPTLQQIHPYVALAFSGATRNQTRTISYGGMLPSNSYSPDRVSLSSVVLVDPRLKNTTINSQMQLDAVIDEQGNAATIERWDAYYNSFNENNENLVRTGTISLPASLYKAKQPTKINSLKGRLILDIQTSREFWEVPNALTVKDVAKTFKTDKGDLTLKITGVTGQDGRYQLHFEGKNPTEPANRVREMGQRFSYNVQNWTKRIDLVDANGINYSNAGGGSSSSNGEFRIDASFVAVKRFGPDGEEGNLPGVPTKIVIEVPTQTRRLEIPFEIKDLPLP